MWVEAYVTADIGKKYAVYFSQGRYKVSLDPWVFTDKLRVQWLDINSLQWSVPQIVQVEWYGNKHGWGFQGLISLETPSNRQCVALIEVIE